MLDIPLEEELVSLSGFTDITQSGLYVGPENPYREKIKYGDKNRDWATVFCIRVSDCFGAFTYYCVRDRVTSL